MLTALFRQFRALLSMLWRKACRIFDIRSHQRWRKSTSKNSSQDGYSQLSNQGKISNGLQSSLPKLQQQSGLSRVLPPSEPFYHYVIVRKDLPINVALAQTVHAAGESAQNTVVPPNTHAVVLSVPDEKSLLDVETKLLRKGIAITAIREPDEPWCGQLMTIGIKPQTREKLRKILANLPLYKE